MNASSRPGFEELDQILDSIKAAIWAPQFAGGSLDLSPHPYSGGAYSLVTGYVPLRVPAAEQSGGVWVCEVYCLCEDGTVTITPRVRRLTSGGSDIVTGSACSGTSSDFSGTGQLQSLSFTPTVGEVYALQAAKSAGTKRNWILGKWYRTNS